VIDRIPPGSEVVENVATPELSAPVPSCVLPFKKVTIPVGFPLAVDDTVAVKVTL
jgi:hypothetical protein